MAIGCNWCGNRLENCKCNFKGKKMKKKKNRELKLAEKFRKQSGELLLKFAIKENLTLKELFAIARILEVKLQIDFIDKEDK